MTENNVIWTNAEIENEDQVSVINKHMESLGKTIQTHISEDFIYIDAKKINWRNQDGYKKVASYNLSPLELARAIVPEHECTFELKKDGDNLYAVVSSHDVPTGGTWHFKGLIDIEDVTSAITCTAIRDQDSLEDFIDSFKEKLKIDLSTWNQKEVTKDYKVVDEGDKVLLISPNVDSNYVEFILYLNEDGYIQDIEYCEDKFENYYINHIIS